MASRFLLCNQIVSDWYAIKDWYCRIRFTTTVDTKILTYTYKKFFIPTGLEATTSPKCLTLCQLSCRSRTRYSRNSLCVCFFWLILLTAPAVEVFYKVLGTFTELRKVFFTIFFFFKYHPVVLPWFPIRLFMQILHYFGLFRRSLNV